jgi:hypothetical protein
MMTASVPTFVNPQMHLTGTTAAPTAVTPTAPATPVTDTPVAAFAGLGTALSGLVAIGGLALLFTVR